VSSRNDAQVKHDSEVWIAIAQNLRAEGKRARDNAGLYPQAREEILKSAASLESAASTAAFAGDKLLPLHVPMPMPEVDPALAQKDDEIRQLKAALEQIRRDLLDPIIVHTNMCRGLIAAPAPRDYFHAAYGESGVKRWQKLERLEKAAKAEEIREYLPTVQELKAAEAAYIEYTNSHPDIHSNRFPTWAQIGSSERRKWVETIRKKASDGKA